MPARDPPPTFEAAPDSPADAGPDVGSRLVAHLRGGRTTSDVGQAGVAVVTTLIFWAPLEPTVALSWLGLFIALIGARSLNRRRRVPAITDPASVLRLLRGDVWLSAAMWGVFALLLVGHRDVELALLMIIIAGLVAAATSTLVADTPSFLGFVALLILPLAGTVLLSGLSRTHMALLALIVLFTPFMVVVHQRAHAILVDQIESNARLRISEENAARGRDFLNALVANAPSAMVVLDSQANVLRVNPAFERVTGYAWGNVHGRALSDLLAEGEGAEALSSFVGSIREGARSVAELRLRRADGHTFWMRLSGTAAGRQAAGSSILIGEDVTEQVLARAAQAAARVEAETAARAKSAFLASMSHEIRTPLNGILGMIELLGDTPLTESQQESVRIIHGSATALLRILNDILDVSKMEAGQLDLEAVDFDLHQVVGEVGRVFGHQAAQKDSELVVDIASDVPEFVRADPLRLRQVLANLVSNAVKFTEDGEVVLSARAVGEVDGATLIRFSVADTGIGIDPEKHELVFAEFGQADTSTTRVHGGTGLGLSISRRLVELMGGRLELDSAPGKGSDFHFVLPLEVAEGPPVRRRGPRVALEGRRFLVVDDNATARRLVREALGAEGALVDEATGVDAGLAALRAGGTGGGYDAIVLDHVMPERDGFELAAEVRADDALSSVPILMLTSSVAVGAKAQARDLRIGGYLAKPLSRRDLVRAIRTLLGVAAPEDGERRLITVETLALEVGALRILVAEDNPVNQQVAGALLRRRGHHVDVVGTGREALEALDAGTYDVVLMDIQMPEMDGLEATRRLRADPRHAELPVIALTARAFQEERDRTREAGMSGFLSKPFTADDLYAVVERWGAHDTPPDLDERPRPEAPRTAEASNERPPVDVDGFRASMRAAGVEDVVQPTLELYVTEAPRAHRAIERAWEASDLDAVSEAAHSMKSSAASVRANRLAELLRQLESRAAEGDADAVGSLLESVGDEHTAVLAYLESLAR